jgi:hydrogenase maturation protease
MIAANSGQILVAGIGNIFLGDDAFGVEVVKRLVPRPLPKHVRVIDFGIRGIDLTYALLDDYAAVIFVDAMPRGGAPGTLYVIEPELPPPDAPNASEAMIELHSLDPVKVLRMARSMGGKVERVLVVGCEPVPINSDEDVVVELSEPVRAAVDEAVTLIESLLNQLIPCTNCPSP